MPHGATVWAALIVTGVFASALAYLIQIWAQQRISATRIAIIFSLETVWAGFFGFVLDGDRLGLVGWTGCALIFVAILVAEPAAAARCAASSLAARARAHSRLNARSAERASRLGAQGRREATSRS